MQLQISNELAERFELFPELAALLHPFLHVGDRVHDCGVVAVELLADVVVGKVEHLTAQVNGDLPCVDDFP